MRAMILAAGRGERMRPLTDHAPKPLLPVSGKPLIVWHLEKLATAGISDVVINLGHLGEQIPVALGDGQRWGLNLHYSQEPPGALETAGGIRHALPLLGDEPFLVINGDVFCDWPVERAAIIAAQFGPETLAHLVMIDNPEHHPSGDFALVGNQLKTQGEPRYTFAGIGIYRPELFSGLPDPKPAKLAPLLRTAMAADQISGEHYAGRWVDVGTPERLAELNQSLR
ncbi:MAG: hypothetical protein RIR18_1827 [Pseudomonadota bacterium]